MKHGLGKLLLGLIPLIGIAGALFNATPAHSFLSGLSAPNQPTRWDLTAFPVQWNLNPTTGTNITGTRAVAAAIQAAFGAWIAAPNTALTVTEGPDSNVSSEAASPSTINLICFICADADFTQDPSTLAITLFTFATASGQPDGHGARSTFAGQMLKADMLFNPADSFRTDSSGTGTDLQTVAMHEAGHFLGLDHSAVVDAVMFPFSPSLRETLAWDDVAGISSLYPQMPPDLNTATITGTVRFASTGGGVFGAHVFAESVTSAAGYAGVRKGPIGTLTLPDGTYTLTGLPQDSYTITAEPLDGPVTNGDVSNFPKVFGHTAVETNFTTRQH